MQQIYIRCFYRRNLEIFQPNLVLVLVSAMAPQQKMVLVMSGLSPSKVVFTCKVLCCIVGYVVDNMFCGGCFVCPLIVAVDLGRCHWTLVAVSPGHLEKWLLLVAVIHFDACCEKRHWQ